MTKIIIVLASFLLVTGASSIGAASAEELDTDAIDAYIESEMRASRLPGLALGIIQDGEIVYLKGYGSAGRGEPVTPETPFIIGSLSKSFTAVAVKQLVEAGKLELDAPVQGYLPWFTMAGDYDPGEITVRHLLVQTSGIPNLAGVTTLAEDSARSLEQEVRDLNATALEHRPGEAYIYSNANYLILGLLIEEVTGRSYSDPVRSEILDPLDMGNSYLSRQEGEAGEMAAGHVRWFGFTSETDVQYLESSLPAGFIISSAEDMCNYLLMHLNQGHYGGVEVLSKESVETMYQPGAATDEGGYAMGLLKRKAGDTTIMNHDGSTQGFNAAMAFSPEEQWGVVVLTNTSGQIEIPAGAITMGVADFLMGNELQNNSRLPFVIYLVLVFVIMALLALAIRSIIILPRKWGQKLKATRPRGFFSLIWRVALPVLLELLVPFMILFYIPAGAGFPVWQLLALFHPDLVYGLLLLAVVMLFKALWRSYLAVKLLSAPALT